MNNKERGKGRRLVESTAGNKALMGVSGSITLFSSAVATLEGATGVNTERDFYIWLASIALLFPSSVVFGISLRRHVDSKKNN